MSKTKANNYRWKFGVSNTEASIYMKQSMYSADEVVRLMSEFAQQEVKSALKKQVRTVLGLAKKPNTNVN